VLLNLAVFVTPHLQKYCRSLAGYVPAITLGATLALSPLAFARAANNPVASLPAQEQAALQSGEAVLTGHDGQYTCRVLVKAPVATVWKVLTDYDNFENYYPNVVSSQIVENKGNRKVFEQVYVIQALIFSKEERVRIAATETYLKQIDFNLVQGDLNSLKGAWRIEPVSSDRVLITHQVSVVPKDKDRTLFYGIYEDTLENLLRAVKQQVEQNAAV
jgi:ribosome-associated toxin RatA of RatAB toxin-antitoxin module